MTIELTMLALSVVLGFVHIVLACVTATRQYGPDWNVGPRDERCRRCRHGRPAAAGAAEFPRDVSAVRRRGADRACRQPAQHADDLGVHLYFWGRLAYLPLYASASRCAHGGLGRRDTGIVLILLALIWSSNRSTASAARGLPLAGDRPRTHRHGTRCRSRSRAGSPAAAGRRARISSNCWPKRMPAARSC